MNNLKKKITFYFKILEKLEQKTFYRVYFFEILYVFKFSFSSTNDYFSKIVKMFRSISQ